MATEYELKFQANPALLAAIAAAYPGEESVIAMETAYYDTPDGALSARRYTLRRRLENGRSICTLKTPAGVARGEWETESDTIADAIPRLIAIGAPAELETLAGAGLVHICGARFTRIAKTITRPDCTLELALDRGVLMGGGREAPLCEVEAELKSGEVAGCDAFGAELECRFGLVVEEKSKFRRALGLFRGE